MNEPLPRWWVTLELAQPCDASCPSIFTTVVSPLFKSLSPRYLLHNVRALATSRRSFPQLGPAVIQCHSVNLTPGNRYPYLHSTWIEGGRSESNHTHTHPSALFLPDLTIIIFQLSTYLAVTRTDLSKSERQQLLHGPLKPERGALFGNQPLDHSRSSNARHQLSTSLRPITTTTFLLVSLIPSRSIGSSLSFCFCLHNVG